MDWIQNKVNSAAGGGNSSEKNEDNLDKGWWDFDLGWRRGSHTDLTLQLSITCRRMFWAKASRITRVPLSKPKMSRSL